MTIQSWFNQRREDDVKEIARFVCEIKDSDVKKRNLRLYKFATGRTAKTDAK